MMDRNARGRMDQGPEGAQAEWLGAMRSLAEQIQKQQQYSQQMTQELMNTYMQLLNTPGSYLSGQAERATKEAELRTAVFGALKTPNYDELTVDEIAGKLDDLSLNELKKIREYEKHNKNRESLIEQIDRKIRAKNS